jgi:hypothetical protein
MLDPGAAVISCTDWQQIVTAINRIIVDLPLDVRRRLHSVYSSYVAAYGLEGVFQRINGRTVAKILDEYCPPTALEVVAEGQQGDVRYTLYERPRSRPDADGQE